METKKRLIAQLESKNLEAAYMTESPKSIGMPGLPLPENWETRKRLIAQLESENLEAAYNTKNPKEAMTKLSKQNSLGIPDLPLPENCDELRRAVKMAIPEPEVNKILAILDQNEILVIENKKLKAQLDLSESSTGLSIARGKRNA